VNHTKHLNSLCEQNVEFLNVKRDGKKSNHYYLKGQVSAFFIIYLRAYFYWRKKRRLFLTALNDMNCNWNTKWFL